MVAVLGYSKAEIRQAVRDMYTLVAEKPDGWTPKREISNEELSTILTGAATTGEYGNPWRFGPKGKR